MLDVKRFFITKNKAELKQLNILKGKRNVICDRNDSRANALRIFKEKKDVNRDRNDSLFFAK